MRGPLLALALLAGAMEVHSGAALAQRPPLQPADLFALEHASDPQISPDGRTIAYVRRSFDPMTDRARSAIWLVDVASGAQRPLLDGTASYSAPRWSPDGRRLAFVSGFDRDAQLHVRWLAEGTTARLTDLPARPGAPVWSPDGRMLAFTAFVAGETKPFVSTMPKPPKGATWAPPPRVVERLQFRFDGQGWLEEGNTQLFVVSADGGAARQLTEGDALAGLGQPAWTPDGRALIVSARPRERELSAPNDSELYRIELSTGTARALTDRRGPDDSPAVAPDGRIAWTGFDDRFQGHQTTRLYVMNADGSGRRELAAGLDRDVEQPRWHVSGAVAFLFDDRGITRLALARADGRVVRLAEGLGGEDLGRPYPGGSFSLARDGAAAFTLTDYDHPADLAVHDGRGTRRLTRLNEALFAGRTLATGERITTRSKDGTEIEGWLLKPPGFDPSRKYPLVLEIHGGPFANYGPRWAAELQMFAAAGHVVLFANPRGSTSYGEAFANHIHHAYPGDDYDDLMAIVDAAIATGFVDPQRLFVTGGSGGGVLTAWIVGRTDRFRAAVVAKPVINWTSFVLSADNPAFFARYWFGRMPWEEGAQAEYWRRSPLSLVGNVKTPTMLLTGEEDWRTPMWESEQYYTALKLRGVPTALVRVPEVGHALVTRPSQLVAKTQYILEWFHRHGGPPPVAPQAQPVPAVAAAGPPEGLVAAVAEPVAAR
jgi:dipeptidyl aminopeptidase/acylaminoacyl peptidase